MWIKTNRQALIELRIREGLSQRQLAKRIGCSGVTICQIESGERNPSPRMAKRIAEALGVTFSAVFSTVMEENFFAVDGHNSNQSACNSNTKAS